MSTTNVTFLNVIFQNDSGIGLPLTIEAPVGTKVHGPEVVPANSKVTINIKRDNCLSTRLIVTDTNHGAMQDFVLTPGKGRRIYWETVEAQFTVGSITGVGKARSGDY